MKERNQIILAKIESTYGTDPVPVEGSNAILTKNLKRTLYDGERVKRDLNLPYMGNDFEFNTGPNVQITFDVELAGASAAGVAPQFGQLLRACGLDETIVADTSVTYGPISDAFESVTIYYNYHGERQIAAGCRGTARIGMSKGQVPMISFTFRGLYARPTAAALPSPTYTAQTPRPFNKSNTSLSVHSYLVNAASFSLDLGCQVSYRNLTESEIIEIVDRLPAGNCTFDAPTLSQKDYFAAMESHSSVITTGAITMTHGPTAGSGGNCVISQPVSQINNLTEESQDGIRVFTASYIPVPTDAGNDEFSIAFT